MEGNMPKQQPQGLASRRNLERLQLELSSIKRGVQSYEVGQSKNGTWGFLRYGIGDEAHDQTEADDPEFDKVFNYSVKEPVVDMKYPAGGSKAGPVTDSLLTPFVHNMSAPNSSVIHCGEGFSNNASDVSNVIGIGDVMELQRANQEENGINFDSISLDLDEIEKKIEQDDH